MSRRPLSKNLGPCNFRKSKPKIEFFRRIGTQARTDFRVVNVYIAFVVTKEGKIRDTRVVKGINEGCDKEALRLIKNMPLWDPGMQQGKLVSSVYGLPIIFRP